MLNHSQTYQCKTSEARKENRRVCVEAKCTDGKCYQESSEPDKDFGQAIAMMEATREAGVYGEKEFYRFVESIQWRRGNMYCKAISWS
ncbi:conjugal transfer protein TraN [Acinetobacter baumannii]|uniref:conjugal transfer protein TraN n=1 Tax=Acinetobacter baumannii TaxID=470 RepID=UPI00352334D0